MLFRQVYDYIRIRMKRGEWHEHDKLPSVRLLAMELNVNRLTVFKAYQLLKQEGLVYVKEKSGYYVSPEHLNNIDAAYQGSALKHASAPDIRNKLSDIHRLEASNQFSKALIDPGLLPNLFLSDYVKRVFDLYPKLMGTYSTAQGDEELRTVLAAYLNQQFYTDCHASELIITTGAQQAIDLITRMWIRPMDAILVERPTYSAALDVFRAQGARLIPVEFAPEGYDMEQVELLMKEHRPRFFYLNPTFHNPTGYTLPADQRKQLLELAEAYQCLLIEDDSFHDIYFDQRPPRPLYAYDTSGWTIYIRSFCKYVAPGLRICAVVGSQDIIDSLIKAKSLADNGTPLVTQKIFLHYFQSTRMQQHLEKLRIALQIRKDVMEEELRQSELPWTWASPNGGLNLWIQLPEGLNAQRLLEEALRQSLTFVPGAICDPLDQIEDHIRLSYSFMNEASIRIGIRVLAQVASDILDREQL